MDALIGVIGEVFRFFTRCVNTRFFPEATNRTGRRFGINIDPN
jgi:hypothetical protein